MKKRGQLIILSGPAGTGKGTIVKSLLKQDDKLKLSVSATTRLPRPNETNGIEYFFKSKDEFEKMIAENEFIEYTSYNGNYYGTPKKPVLNSLAEGNSVILEIEVEGASNASRTFPEAIMVFLAPPSKKVLRERLTGRGTETPEVIEKRLKIAEEELKLASNYKYIVVNDTVENAVNTINMIRAYEELETILNDVESDKDEIRIAKKIVSESENFSSETKANNYNCVSIARKSLVANNAALIEFLNQ